MIIDVSVIERILNKYEFFEIDYFTNKKIILFNLINISRCVQG